ncbi:MAG: SDR family oxidoreductase [Steroidobacteraceae bacterium]|nr:SDR family oxidoreductase [Steroidobacteraceae bacterium]
MTARLLLNSPIVVAGGAGFLGSHLCERLLAAGHAVVCLDNFSTGRRSNLEHLLESAPLTIQSWDIAEPLLLMGVTQIFNLACPASPPHYQADPIRTTMTSVRGAYNLLELARTNGVPLLQASTSEVYGDPTVHPQTEAYWGHVNPTGTRACYDEGKRCAESLCFDYQREHDVNVKVARIFNTYGPRMRVDDGRVVSNFIVQALQSKPLTIYGDGSQTRSFCYVDDLVEGLVRFMSAKEVLRTPVNLGNPEEFTILELADLVLELTGSRSRTVFQPLPSDDPTQRCPNIDLARRALGWEPRTTLRVGLERTIAYFDRVLAGEPRRRRSRAKLHAVDPNARVQPAPATLEPATRQAGHVQR